MGEFWRRLRVVGLFPGPLREAGWPIIRKTALDWHGYRCPQKTPDTELAGGQADKRVVIKTPIHAVSSMVRQSIGVGNVEQSPSLRVPIMQIVADLLPC